MPRPSAIFALILGVFATAAPVAAQHLGSPVAPRGFFLLEAMGEFGQISERFGDGGRELLDGGRFAAPLNAERFPALEGAQAGLRALLEDPDASFTAGSLSSRIEVNHQQVPFRLAYGLFDRVTLGVTVPMVRRRVDAGVETFGVGADIGANPARGAGLGTVNAFRSAANSALSELQDAVIALCAEEGDDSEGCISGWTDHDRVASLLGRLNDAWNTLDFFPLAGSAHGATLQGAWAGARADLERWGAVGPDSVPLATGFDVEGLRDAIVDPVWGDDQNGFPLASPRMQYMLGDVEAHVAIGLVGFPSGPGADASSAGGFRVRSAVEGSVRFATGIVDSFTVVTPMTPISGHAGFGARWVTDVLAGSRVGLLVDVGWKTFAENTGTVVAFDEEDGWSAALARVTATGSPGDRLRVAASPRFVIAPGLSVGGGFEMIRTSESRWRAAVSGDQAVSRVIPAWTSMHGAVELRFAGWNEPVVAGLPFPVELVFRGVRTVSGSGGAPAEDRIELGARLLRRR